MSVYLERYAFKSLKLAENQPNNLGLVVVVPVYNEPDITPALESLYNCELPAIHVEVILVINEAEDSEAKVIQQNNVTYLQAAEWLASHQKPGISFYCSRLKLPKRHAGVGLARKAGMDEATRRFESIGNKKGIILCYDADCKCSPNYLTEVYNAFDTRELQCASIYYEHPINFLNESELSGIVQYELHLRYYVNALRRAGYPYAFHTVGSSMAVRSDMYQKAGGMNRRKAGEDFHFLHKVIPYGNFGEVNTTTVYPSPRVSDRVPFGTGKAMGTWLKEEKSELLSYHPEIFRLLNELLVSVPYHFKNSNYTKFETRLSSAVIRFLKDANYENELIRINKQSTTPEMFLNKWFHWFDGLKALHFVHYLRDNYYTSIPVTKAASLLVNLNEDDPLKLLKHYRMLDKEFKEGKINLKHLFSEYQ